MHKIALMDPILGPPNCLTCGRGNTPDDPDTLDDFWVMDLERDVNWGDPAYICKYCCGKIAEACGHVPLSAYEEQEAMVRQHLETIHQVEAERDSLRRRFRVAQTGTKAIKSARKQSARS
jgi:hypothetical protein